MTNYIVYINYRDFSQSYNYIEVVSLSESDNLKEKIQELKEALAHEFGRHDIYDIKRI